MADLKFTITEKYVSDQFGNRASLFRWGDIESAKESLMSLEDCFGCSDCSGCSDCYYCSDCSHCSGCYRCSDCSGCSGCSDCSRCSDCSHCYDCSDCSDCSDCYYCFDCSDCSRCSDNKGLASGDATPKITNIHQKIADATAENGSLEMGNWHTCDTTHCRAGWAIHLAGDAGYDLERRTSTQFAAMMIFKASSPIRVFPPRFFESDEVARADILRCATEELALPEV